MIFSSFPFVLFFSFYLPLHWLLPNRYRLHLVLAGSLFFYGYYRIEYLWIPVVLTAIAYLGGLLLERSPENHARRRALTLTVVALLAPLFFYKYTDFIVVSVLGPLFHVRQKILNLPLPLGLSFFTFTLIAYVVDVYDRRFPMERQFRVLLAYVLYFPHQIAGPILKPAALIPQLKAPKTALRTPFTYAILLIALGLVKKVILADSMAPWVNAAYLPSGRSLGFGDLLLAFYGFPLQIYCDFSGYTDMALGLALLLGVRLPANFSRPYAADSLIDFWRRWHITLSVWLRDYLYIRLGGNRNGFARQIRNILITMILGGLWHGANWTFGAWGALHAAGVASTHAWRHFQINRFVPPVPRWLRVLATFHFVSVAWVFFRAPDFSTAIQFFQGLFSAPAGNFHRFALGNAYPLLLLAGFYATHVFDDTKPLHSFVRRTPKPVVWAIAASVAIGVFALNGGTSAAFIYFDF